MPALTRSPRSRIVVPLVALSLCALASVAGAGPQDTRVGETRLVYDKKGTILKAEPTATSPAVTTLPASTPVVVDEVRLPWVKVHAASGGAGWIRAYQAIEPVALSAAPPPAHIEGAAEGGTGTRDASAAGRQLTAKTEASYRANRADLANAYQWVDAIARETAAMDAAESITFLMEGDLGRRGHDYLLPGRLPKEEIDADDGGGGGEPAGMDGGIGGALGGLGGLLRKAGVKVPKEADRLIGFAKTLKKYSDQMHQSFTPTQEYYLGRAVAANAIAQFRIDPNAARRRYVRRVGDAIVRLSNRLGPTVGGYHFDVLDSDEVNGVSGPGGWVLLTRGAVEACRTEDELAGILCHELAHVSLRHGENVLRKSKQFQARLQAGTELLTQATGVGDSRLGQALLDVFTSAVGEMGKTALEHNYGSQLEFEADSEGAQNLWDVYYDWSALGRYLGRLGQDPHHNATDASHAAPSVRATQLNGVTAQIGPVDLTPAILEGRRTRLAVALGRPVAPPPAPAPAPPPSSSSAPPAPTPYPPPGSPSGSSHPAPLPPPPPPPLPLPK